MAKKFNGGSSTGTWGPRPGVTADNYIIPGPGGKFEEAKGEAIEYVRLAGTHFMLTPDKPEHCNVWHRYFTLKGDKKRLKSMKLWLKGELGRQHGFQFGVPAEWPWMFDQSVDEAQCRGMRSMP